MRGFLVNQIAQPRKEVLFQFVLPHQGFCLKQVLRVQEVEAALVMGNQEWAEKAEKTPDVEVTVELEGYRLEEVFL